MGEVDRRILFEALGLRIDLNDYQTESSSEQDEEDSNLKVALHPNSGSVKIAVNDDDSESEDKVCDDSESDGKVCDDSDDDLASGYSPLIK